MRKNSFLKKKFTPPPFFFLKMLEIALKREKNMKYFKNS